MREFLTGNEAIARAALRANCRFCAEHTTVPDGSIADALENAARRIDHRGDFARPTVVRAEDAVSAIGQCIGAAMAGARAMTETSASGFSRIADDIAFAQVAEIPIVIVDDQRTGIADDEGDVLVSGNMTTGGYPLPVLAATDAATAYRLCVEAFDIADRLRTPVVLLTSDGVGRARQTVDLDAITTGRGYTRTAQTSRSADAESAFAAITDVPDFHPVGSANAARFDRLAVGHSSSQAIERAGIERRRAHLIAKFAADRHRLAHSDFDPDPRADVLIISYGLANGAACEATHRLRTAGERVAHLALYSLWPIAADAVERAITRRVRRVIMPELNAHLYVGALRQVIRRDVSIESLVRYDGGLIHPDAIVQRMLRSPCG